jgi:pimeloyl-ACP methyl ester carboxylesterase
VKGNERIYFEHYWNDFAADKTRSIPEANRKAYAAAYARPGRMRAGWAYSAKDFAVLARIKLPMPVLSVGGDKTNGDVLRRHVKLVVSDATVILLRDTGHWLMEQRPRETTEALLKFL